MEERFNYSITLILLFHVLIIASCSTKSGQFIPGTLADGKYDSEFPTTYASDILERTSHSVKMINTIAYYEGYVFPKNEHVTIKQILSGKYVAKADSTINFRNSTSGTSTIIYSERKRIAILTSAHVVAHPDTLITYHLSDETDAIRPIESFSLKKIQRNILIGISEGSGFEVLAFGRDLDVAILGKEFFSTPVNRIPVFDLPSGSARELQWGSFVYLIGWPKGQKMVTRGIVSDPDRDKRHSFLIDALFNRGFSGGIVLAIRDGIPNLELVGMICSVSASSERVLVPEMDTDDLIDRPRLPYKDEIYIESRKQIDYGITYAVSIETIVEFVKAHKDSFAESGYDSDRFFR